MKGRLLRITLLLAAMLSGAGTLFMIGSGIMILTFPAPNLEGVGNRGENLQVISSGSNDFRFAVLGDTQKGVESFRKLTAELEVDFAVHIGDMVADNDEGHWKLFFDGLNIRPFVSAPGNHDLKGEYPGFPMFLGPEQASFARGSCRFIIMNSVGDDSFDESWFRKELSLVREENIFIFMHVPPFDPDQKDLTPRKGWEKFFEMLPAFPVRTVFTGHAHEFAERKYHNVTYVTNGQGGDYDSWAFDTPVFASVITVEGKNVKSETVQRDPTHTFWGTLKHGVIGHMGNYPVGCWIGSIALLGLFFFSCRYYLQFRRLAMYSSSRMGTFD